MAGLLRQINTPERWNALIAEAAAEEQEAAATYSQVAKRSCGPELHRLKADYDAAKAWREELEQARAVLLLAGAAVPERCWSCHKGFSPHVPPGRVSLPAGLAVCTGCAARLDLVIRHRRQLREAA